MPRWSNNGKVVALRKSHERQLNTSVAYRSEKLVGCLNISTDNLRIDGRAASVRRTATDIQVCCPLPFRAGKMLMGSNLHATDLQELRFFMEVNHGDLSHLHMAAVRVVALSAQSFGQSSAPVNSPNINSSPNQHQG